ncbi:hypothetical protein [Reyranella sp. CPCC 100927]|uniref:hypothetical protein n=1 Tax=Reyranella sp. CPCC 100927 TaxID=2599616 RepID=UPI0011B5721F|nr:hypothetical protein [Reyranella sp. CPCC 100927]TWT11614.1 hypothetical protein FQU96_14140 [Reyranella sp. CPCC 100927]
MRLIRTPLALLPLLLVGTLAACTVRTERTERQVYAPPPAGTVVYPSTAYYYYPSRTYYYDRDRYHPAYYSY